MTKEQFRERLTQFPGVRAREVEVTGNGKYVAKMSTTTFEGVDEAERQERVYAFLREQFSESDMSAIEFIITNAPGDPAPC